MTIHLMGIRDVDIAISESTGDSVIITVHDSSMPSAAYDYIKFESVEALGRWIQAYKHTRTD